MPDPVPLDRPLMIRVSAAFYAELEAQAAREQRRVSDMTRLLLDRGMTAPATSIAAGKGNGPYDAGYSKGWADCFANTRRRFQAGELAWKVKTLEARS